MTRFISALRFPSRPPRKANYEGSWSGMLSTDHSKPSSRIQQTSKKYPLEHRLPASQRIAWAPFSRPMWAPTIYESTSSSSRKSLLTSVEGDLGQHFGLQLRKDFRYFAEEVFAVSPGEFVDAGAIPAFCAVVIHRRVQR